MFRLIAQVIPAENASVVPTLIMAFPAFQTASAYRAIAIWQEV